MICGIRGITHFRKYYGKMFNFQVVNTAPLLLKVFNNTVHSFAGLWSYYLILACPDVTVGVSEKQETAMHCAIQILHRLVGEMVKVQDSELETSQCHM